MRVATFNVLHGASPADGVVDLGRFAAAVRGLDADVLALQEVDRGLARSGGADLVAVAAAAMGASDHRFAPALEADGSGGLVRAQGTVAPAAYGVALLTRFPAHSWRLLRLPVLRTRVPVLFEGRRPAVVGDEARVAVSARIATPYGELVVACAHLSLVPLWNALQLRRIAGTLRPDLLVGDFNMEPGAARRASGLDPLASGPTFPADAPTRQIDHILGARRMRATRPGAVLHLPLSDHRALAVDVATR